MDHVVIEYMRNPGQWVLIYDFVRENYNACTDEEFVAQVDATWGGYRDSLPGRDYIARLRDFDDDFVYEQSIARIGRMASYPDNIAIARRSKINVALSGKMKNMIKVGIKRVNGKLSLLVDAKEFHEQLDEIGCTYTGNKYDDAPPAASTVASSTHHMSTNVLLMRDYREVEIVEQKKVGDTVEKTVTKVPVTACIDLSTVWANPPSFDNLKKLCGSANEAARKILEHYQPIDISIEIHKKVVKH